ncbi:DUF4129 domain-containing protein [Bacteroides pyogenes]|uniref:DUF4129 domain-containing protein n=1 Tax=Bacteroides pyogenes TaxID=310300 RepID=A0A5D3EJU0_9BACE|nr:DUF4129 domain-containing protein [Bacteroides pyogenes]MBR8709165.1 hypothetical protein [Bacteroides pyogenes]MBR8718021.1 hypothetical protein [Bacteroides pyogenes]MBR8747525.1 hypothetical protein [Bacteroides pyogenes]MBR8757811.1 hypothetical protein [Bacteroides pyogenes]MBR8781063.1 hypothetical protein [Bacteroides pyogenes]
MQITSSVDTLVCDTAQIAVWQSDERFAYHRELVTPDINVFEWLSEKFFGLLRRVFGSRFVEEYSAVVLIVIAIIILGLLGWLVYKKYPGLFVRTDKKTPAYAIEEDTIYGVDFEKAIDEALSRPDYREAVRLLYLQTLKLLSDEGRIDWQLYKTPTQYVHEERTPAFARLTNHFLRVRYGNFDASEQLFDAMRTLQAEMKEGGER